MGEEVVLAVCRFRRSLELNSIDNLQVYCPKGESITRYVAIVNSSVAILLDLFISVLSVKTSQTTISIYYLFILPLHSYLIIPPATVDR